MLVGRQEQMQAARDWKALLRQANGRLEERGPWQLAVLLMRHVEHLEHAWHADRAPPDDRVTQCQGLALGIEEAIWGGCGRRCLTAIERHYLHPVIEQEQCPAANARGLWLSQSQHHLRGNSRINGRSTLLQDVVASLGRQGIGVAIIARLARTKTFSVKPVALSGAISGLPEIGGTSIESGSLSAIGKEGDTRPGCQASYALWMLTPPSTAQVCPVT